MGTQGYRGVRRTPRNASPHGELRLRVRVLDSRATASAVRVAIESTDGRTVWRTVGVSSDVINASWQALRDSVEYMLKNCREAPGGAQTELHIPSAR